MPEYCNPDEAGRSVNEFRGNDFEDASLEDVEFRGGIDLSLQKLPEHPDYVFLKEAPMALARARRHVEAWQNSRMRHAADIVLRVLQVSVDTGQDQLLIRQSSFDDSEGLRGLFGFLRTL